MRSRMGGPMCPPVVGITNSPNVGENTQNVSARRTHRSAPTAKGKDGRNLSDAFCQFNALYLDDKWCIPRKRRRVCLCTTLVSHRRGGPMCPPVVGTTNSPNVGENTQVVSARRIHRSAPTAKGKDGRNLSDVVCQFNALNWEVLCSQPPTGNRLPIG